jgi:hypothetical protein
VAYGGFSPADSIVEVSGLYTPEAMIEIEAITTVS